MVGAVSWLPWIVLGATLLLQGKCRVSGRNVVDSPDGHLTIQSFNTTTLLPGCLIAVVLAMQIVTHTLLVMYAVYLLAGMVIWYFVLICPNRRGALKRLWLPLLIIPLLAGLLGAAQLLPLWELTQFSNRALSPTEAAEYALTPVQLLVGLLLPSAQGGHEYVIYPGLVTLLLAPFGLSRRNRWTWFYAVLVIFAILFALGPATPLHGLFYRFAPGFAWVRTPARMFFVAALGLAVLVGFGVDRLRQAHWSASGQRWLMRLAVTIGGLALLIGLGLALRFGQLNRATLALALVTPVGLGLLGLRARRILSAQATLIGLGLLLYLDLASFDLSMLRFLPLDEALAPGRAAAEYLKGERSKGGEVLRVYSPSYSLPIQTAAAANLQLADGVEPVHLAVYDQFMARAGGYNDAGFSVTIPNFGDKPLASALRETKPNLKLLGLLNVTYLASAFPMNWPGLTPETEIKGTYIYRNEYALPRAWVAHQTVLAERDWLAQLESLPDLAETVVIDPTTAGGQLSAASHSPPSSQLRPGTAVVITHYSANRIEMETTITTPGWLVVSEVWYPGWQATVNGAPQPVAKVDGLLRGVYLKEAGVYHITLLYHSWTVVWGGWISSITAILMLGYLIISTTYRYFSTGRVVWDGNSSC